MSEKNLYVQLSDHLKGLKAELPEKDILLVSHMLQPADIQADAKREVIELFSRGVSTLAEDARSKGRGDFALAAQRASLRSSGLARTLNVKAPKFEDIGDGHSEANRLRSLLATLREDLPVSAEKLMDAIDFAKRHDAHFGDDGLSPDEIEIMRKVMDGKNQVLDDPSFMQLQSVHHQMAYMCRFLQEEYEGLEIVLSNVLDELAPPPKAPEPRTPKGPKMPGRKLW